MTPRRIEHESSVAGQFGTPIRAVEGFASIQRADPEPFRVEIQPGQGRGVVAPVGELDLATAGQLQNVMLEQGHREHHVLVIDLGGLSFMDCSGVRILLEAHAQARQTDKRLQIICPRGQIRRLLFLSAADQQLNLVEDSPPKTATS